MMFDTLAAYVAWRNNRRAVYRELTKRIRDTKQNMAVASRTGKYAGLMQVFLRSLRKDAIAMMEQRVVAKKLAKQAEWNQPV